MFTVIYNAGTGILRAIGDSRTPLYILAFTSVLNIGLDVLFVAVFHWGTAGVGIATILADDIQVSVRLIGDTLALATLNDFARNMVDHPDVLARLGALASETAGRPIRVQTTTPDAPELQRSASEINDRLEALRQFDIVQFIDHSTED